MLLSVNCQSLNGCKTFIDGELYDLEDVLPEFDLRISKTARLLGSLCKPIDISKLESKEYTYKPNKQFPSLAPNMLIVFDLINEESVINPVSYLNIKKDIFWIARCKTYRNLLHTNVPRNNFSMRLSGAKQEYDEKTDIEVVVSSLNLQIDNKTLAGIKLTFRCEKDSILEMRHNYFDSKTKQACFTYTGPSACPVLIPDFVNFFSRNMAFILLLVLTSMIGIFLGKRSERVAMSLTTIQATIMMLSAALVVTKNNSDFNLEHKENYFGLSLAMISLMAAFLSFSYKRLALFFTCISVSYSITWTIMYCSTVLFGTRVSLTFLMVMNLAISLAILLLCYLLPTFRERYSYRVYSAITNPFFLCMAASIYFDVYLDIVTFDAYTSWGKIDTVTWKGWIFLVVQIILSAALLFKAIKWDTKDRVRSKSNINKLTETFRAARHDWRGSDIDLNSSRKDISIIRVEM